MLRLETVDEGNWRIPLAVSEVQRRYVADSVTILARAYAYRNANSRACIVFNDDTPVGIVLYYDNPDFGTYIFSELFIDERYQHRGFGMEASKLVLDEMRAAGRFNKVELCYIDGNNVAKSMYEKLGFSEIDRDEDEIIMELTL